MDNANNALAALYVVVTYFTNGDARLTTLGLRPSHFGPSHTTVPAADVPHYVNGVAADAARYHTAVYLAVVPEGFRYTCSWEKQNRHEIVNNATGETREIAGDLVFVP